MARDAAHSDTPLRPEAAGARPAFEQDLRRRMETFSALIEDARALAEKRRDATAKSAAASERRPLIASSVSMALQDKRYGDYARKTVAALARKQRIAKAVCSSSCCESRFPLRSAGSPPICNF